MKSQTCCRWTAKYPGANDWEVTLIFSNTIHRSQNDKMLTKAPSFVVLYFPEEKS
jgi:hypothetical protein